MVRKSPQTDSQAGAPNLRRSLRRRSIAGLAVLLVGLVASGIITGITVTTERNNERRLLNFDAKQAAAVIGETAPDVLDPLTFTADVSAVSNGSPAVFNRYLAPYQGPGKPFTYVALFDVSSGAPQLVTSLGSRLPTVSEAAFGAFLDRAVTSPGLHVLDRLTSTPPHISYAIGSVDPSPFVVFAQGTLPLDRKLHLASGAAFSELDYSLYLGNSQRPVNLLASTTPRPLRGGSAVRTITFGDTVLTLVAAPRGYLAGTLAAASPWIVGALAVLATLIGAWSFALLGRRRAAAEMAAKESQRMLDQQRRIAEALQKALLPVDLPPIEGLEVAVRYVAGMDGADIGGDWYDLIAFDRHRFFFVVGDVSGRGVRAATVMAQLHFAIRAYRTQGDPPEVILTKLGQLLNARRDGHIATVLCGLVDVDAHTVCVTSAGHLPPLLIEHGRCGYLSTAVGPPIGVPTPTTYQPRTLTVSPGSTLLAYTDGLVERRGEHLDVGLGRLREAALDEEAEATPTLEHLLDHVLETLAPRGSEDDIAILAMQWTH